MDGEQLSVFDYKQLSPELAIEAQAVAERVHLRMRRAAEDIIEIGKDLIEMKAKLPHGCFLPWIKSEFGMSHKTARNFMLSAEKFGLKVEIISTFNPTVIFELTSAPDEVIEKAIASSENGEKVSVKEVQEWKKRATPGESITYPKAKASVGEYKIQPEPTHADLLPVLDDDSYQEEVSGEFPTEEEVEVDTNSCSEGVTGVTAPKYDMGALGSSKSKEHYTPKSVLVVVEKVLGVIDLDPCANPGKSVPANAHFTKEDNGLVRDWNGSVFMNPPFGDAIADWVTKLDREYRAGRVTEAIALFPARTDTNWFQVFETRTLCFWKGRITFVGNETAAPFPTVFAYFGADDSVFVEIFHAHGLVYRPAQ